MKKINAGDIGKYIEALEGLVAEKTGEADRNEDEVVKMLVKALADEWLQKQDDAGLHYLRGNALVKAGRRTEAMNAYLHASRLDPDSPAVEALALWRGIMDFYCKDMYNP